MTAIGVTTLYNPHLLTKEDLIRGFAARRPLLERLTADVRREEARVPQHHLIIGQRGQGKTTLLRRLAYAIEDDASLHQVWKPLLFPEEQYNVASLGVFWMNCVDALSDSLESGGHEAAAAALDARLAAAGRDGGLELLLAEAARLDRRFVLLIDNIDIVLDRIGKDEEWDFRRVISTEPRLLIIGASSRAREAFYDYGRAFYDFFQVHELGGLSDAETFQVLRELAAQAADARVARIVDQQPGRVKALRELTGGNPRTLTLLFHILAQGPDANVERDIEQLLDIHTPLYKARLEELPPQAQQMVDAMALHWDPLTAAMLSDLVRLSVNQTSAQLKRLEDLGVVERTDWHGEKKNAFQIAERFFNIWYLMRASRRLRRQLMWLVRFLESWFSREELTAHARDCLRRDPDSVGRERFAAMSFALSEIVESERLRSSLEHAGLHAAVETKPAPFDFSDLRPELLDKKDRMEYMAKLRNIALGARNDWGDIDPEELWRLLGGSPRYERNEKERIATSLGQLERRGLQQLFEQLKRDECELLSACRTEPPVVHLLYDALAEGDMADPYDWKSACAVADRKGLTTMPHFAAMSRYVLTGCSALSDGEAAQAESALTEMTKEGDLAARAWSSLGALRSRDPKLCSDAEAAYRKAVELDPRSGAAWYGLGCALGNLKRYVEAESAHRAALEVDPQFSYAWNGLGNALAHQSRYAEAEFFFRKAIELGLQLAHPWNGLGNVLQALTRSSEAETAFRKAIDLDPRFAHAWNGLGNSLRTMGQYPEAETTFRKSLGLDPLLPHPWNGLGNVLADQERYAEAEEAYRETIRLAVESPCPWSNLGKTLTLLGGRDEEAGEAHLRAYRLDQARVSDMRLFLAACERLSRTDRGRDSAENILRQATELAPDQAEIGFAFAAVLVAKGKGSEGRSVLARLAANESVLGNDVSTEFFRVVVESGRAAEAATLLNETGGDRRWRPLYEALRAAAEGDRKYLRRVAPEVRRVAEEIYDRIAPQKGEGAP